ncbi:MAG: T9SS type A sorting domain-containing protein [Bacteroidota bacterium]|nr:T9SS type A sorting domain-containing protein [Bacteroidota bacterium]
MRKVYLILSTIFFYSGVSAQTLFDSFTDGDFTTSPVWIGSTTSWGIVVNSDVAAGATGSNTIRLSAPAVNQTDYLTSQIAIWGTSQEWGFFLGRRAQAATAANQSYFWLYANEANLTLLTVDGYRIAFGDDSGGDDIRLEYIVNGVVSSTVITSTGSTPNTITDFGILIRVTRSLLGTWEIFTSILPVASGSGAIATDIPNAANANISQGTGTNNSLAPATNNYIGIAAFHSTGPDAIIGVEFDQIYFTPSVTTNTITLTSVSSLVFNLTDCNDTETGTIDFTSTGTFLAGNTYNLELSDALGSFASPLIIGSELSTANTESVPFTIPAGTLNGTQYKIRVVSDNPSATSDLTADITINQAGSCLSAATDYFRSRNTGNWASTATWDSSPDNISWHPATLVPTSSANTITIRNLHTVTVFIDANMDQVTIENGGILTHTAGILTINDDASGDDFIIQSGGRFTLNFAGNAPVFSPSTASANINTGGALRVTAGGMTGAGAGVNSVNYIYQDASVVEVTIAFSTSGVTYFPNVNATTIPIFRVLTNLIVGGGTPTIFNGVFETDFPISFQNAGNKTFRNGIRGTGDVTALATSGTFYINGITAELGGTGIITTPPTRLEIGSASGTTVSVTASKTVVGNISLLPTNTFVDLGNFILTVSGIITGGGANSFIRTNATGFLTLNTVTNKTFPIGVGSSYNPLVIANGGGLPNYSARVAVGINPVIAFPTYGINRTWNLFASSAMSGVTVVFQYATADANAGALPQPQTMEILQNDGISWSIIPGNMNINPVGADPAFTITSVTGLGIGMVSTPYALGITGTQILPLNCIIAAQSKKINNTGLISWEVSSCSEVLNFEIQRLVNGSAFLTIGRVTPGSALAHSYTDAALAGGTNLYRIKINGINGAFKYSNTVAIINDTKGLLITALSPNPVADKAALIINAAKPEIVNFIIYSISGQPVKQWQAMVTEGSNTIAVNTTGLAAGIYHLAATSADAKTVMRFVKQ